MKNLSILLIGLLIFASCSNNTLIKKLPLHPKYENEINYLGKSRTGTIIFENNLELKVEIMKIEEDSLYYQVTSQSQQISLALNEVKQISFKDHTIGTFHGLGLGLGMGVAVGYASIDWDVEMAGLGMLLYMGVGILAGSVYGGISGTDLNYIFVDQDK